MKIDKFNGAVVFDMAYPTPRRRAKHAALVIELGIDVDSMTPEESTAWNTGYLLSLTSDIKVKGDGGALVVLKEFWSLANSGEPIAEAIDFYLDNVHYDVHLAWLEALTQSKQPVIPVPLEQKPPELLTEAERADPN